MAFLPILGLVAAGVSAVGAVAGGVSQMNAANAAADYEKKAAAENARRQSVDARRQLGKMRAGYGASGVTMAGSPLDVLEDSAREAELDRLTILQSGKLRAKRYEAQGQEAFIQGVGGAANALLSGGLDYYESTAGTKPKQTA